LNQLLRSQLVRYYGYDSNVARGKGKKPEEKTEISEIEAPPLAKELKSAGPTSFEKFMKQIRFSVSTLANVVRRAPGLN
jgi:hypothetical protein